MARDPERCPACGDGSLLNYCSTCGEKRFEPEHLTLRHFAAESVAQVSDVDSKLLRSFRTLVTRPGTLTAAYLGGRRKLYLRPLQIFLLCNVTFFFLESAVGSTGPFSTPLQTHLYNVPYRHLTQRLVMERIAELEITAREYERSFNAVVDRQSRTLVILMVPLFALAAGLLYAWSRRPVLTHLIFSMHTYSFLLLVITAVMLVASGVFKLLGALGADVNAIDRHFDDGISLFLLVVMSFYLYVGQRRVYEAGPVVTGLRTLVLLFCLAYVLVAYRLALFFTSYWLA